MSKKVTSIFVHCGVLGWLIGFLACNDKSAVGGRMFTQGLILGLIGLVPFIGWVIGPVGLVLAIINIAKGDEDYKLPVIGEVNWFKNI